MSRLSRPCTICLLLTVQLSLAQTVLAEESLRWKLQTGETLNYRMLQKMEMTTAGMGTAVEQILEMTWHVREIDDQGVATIEQAVERIQMTMEGPFGEAKYDSAKDDSPPGLLAMAGPIYKAMTSSTFELRMTNRGEIVDVKIPEALMEALKNLPGKAAMGDMLSEEGFKRMMLQSAMTLPEDYPQKGDAWSTKTVMENPMFGKQTIAMSYTYVEDREQAGESFAVFQPGMTMKIEGTPAVTVEVTEEESTGEYLFNKAAGRLDSSNLVMDLKMQLTIGGQTVDTNLKQTIDVQVSPAAAQLQLEPASTTP